MRDHSGNCFHIIDILASLFPTVACTCERHEAGHVKRSLMTGTSPDPVCGCSAANDHVVHGGAATPPCAPAPVPSAARCRGDRRGRLRCLLHRYATSAADDGQHARRFHRHQRRRGWRTHRADVSRRRPRRRAPNTPGKLRRRAHRGGPPMKPSRLLTFGGGDVTPSRPGRVCERASRPHSRRILRARRRRGRRTTWLRKSSSLMTSTAPKVTASSRIGSVSVPTSTRSTCARRIC